MVNTSRKLITFVVKFLRYAPTDLRQTCRLYFKSILLYILVMFCLPPHRYYQLTD